MYYRLGVWAQYMLSVTLMASLCHSNLDNYSAGNLHSKSRIEALV